MVSGLLRDPRRWIWLVIPRAARLAEFAQFPQGGEWLTHDGRVMAVADWDDPASDGFDYRVGGALHFSIRRAERTAAI